MIRSYSELRRLDTLDERFAYLSLSGQVGRVTFGFERFLNQNFYTSPEWRHVRHVVIARDYGRDLGVENYEIHDRVYIHHMNPLTREQILNHDRNMLDPEFLISVSHRTHNAIHYGDQNSLLRLPIERRPGDTKLW